MLFQELPHALRNEVAWQACKAVFRQACTALHCCQSKEQQLQLWNGCWHWQGQSVLHVTALSTQRIPTASVPPTCPSSKPQAGAAAAGDG